MKLQVDSSPFGSQGRTRVLLALYLQGDSYPRELERLLKLDIVTVRRALLSLERDGMVSARNVGKTRQFSLEPRYFARKELAAYLERLAEADSDLAATTSRIRRRPRRTAKKL